MVTHPQLPTSEAERAKRTARFLLGIDCDHCGHRVQGQHAGPHADGCPEDHRQEET